MAFTIPERIMHAYNAFKVRKEEEPLGPGYQSSYYSGGRPDRQRTATTNERTILASILTRISIDVAAVEFLHVRTDADGRYESKMPSDLNECLTVQANIDQGASHFRQDVALSLIQDGSIAIVPVDTTINPDISGGYDIKSMRVGQITGWFPSSVKCRVYNEAIGSRQEIVLPKESTAIIENPFYLVMNETNSTLNRLIRKLNYLDVVDKQSSSGKLDLIIQLPYVVRSDQKKAAVEKRRKELEEQLQGSTYGVAYADSTEKITQLNRPAENNLLAQVEYLTKQLYSELGLTNEVMNGTADEKTMINYYNRTVEPILRAIAEGMRRTFLTKTARTQHQSIVYFRDPFKLIDIASAADMVDKTTRNEVMTANEWRSIFGLRPSKDAGADELRNKNIPEPTDPSKNPEDPAPVEKPEGDNQNGSSNSDPAGL